jgi:glutaredoxin 3
MQDVTIYTRTLCGYSRRAKDLLRRKGVDYTEIDIQQDPSREREMIERAGKHTAPQVFVGDRHLGGSDDLQELEDRGELDALLRA